jgi:hypothetical protein
LASVHNGRAPRVFQEPTQSSEFGGSWDLSSRGRVRRQLLRATAAALALTPVLMALTPAVVALALAKVPGA